MTQTGGDTVIEDTSELEDGPATPGPVKQRPRRRGRSLVARVRDLLTQHDVRAAVLPLAAVVLMVAYFGTRESGFLSVTNMTVMASQAGPLLIVALGATFVVLMGSIDLSVGAIAGLSAAIAAILLNDAELGGLVIPLAAVAGAGAGAVNAFCVTYLRLPSFIVTLGTLSIFAGVTKTVLEGQALLVRDIDYGRFANGQLVPEIPNVLLAGIILWLFMIVLNQRTRFGRYIVAIGAGEQVAQLSGIPVRRYKTAAFVLSGAMAGLGGAFLLAELGSATPQLGGSYLLEVIAAIVVGGTALTGGVGAVSRTLLGVVLITILSNGLNVSGVSPWTQEIVTGLVIIVAVLTTLDRERMQDIIK